MATNPKEVLQAGQSVPESTAENIEKKSRTPWYKIYHHVTKASNKFFKRLNSEKSNEGDTSQKASGSINILNDSQHSTSSDHKSDAKSDTPQQTSQVMAPNILPNTQDLSENISTTQVTYGHSASAQSKNTPNDVDQESDEEKNSSTAVGHAEQDTSHRKKLPHNTIKMMRTFTQTSQTKPNIETTYSDKQQQNVHTDDKEPTQIKPGQEDSAITSDRDQDNPTPTSQSKITTVDEAAIHDFKDDITSHDNDRKDKWVPLVTGTNETSDRSLTTNSLEATKALALHPPTSEVTDYFKFNVLATILKHPKTPYIAAALFVVAVGVLVALTYGAAACPTIALWLAPLAPPAFWAVVAATGLVAAVAGASFIGAYFNSRFFPPASNDNPIASNIANMEP